MTIAAMALMGVASLVAVLNLIGKYSARQRARRGDSGSYSSVALISIVLCYLAWKLSPDTIGLWAFVPTLLDPGTWAIVILPFCLAWRAISK